MSRLHELFRPKPQPAAAPQMLPGLKDFDQPVAAKQPKQIGPRSRVEDLVTCCGPGEYLIRIPRDREPDFLRTPFDVAHEMTLARLMSGNLDWPDQPQAVTRPEARVAVIRRVAESEREFKAMLENEGLNPVEHPWTEPSPEGRKQLTERRTARELLGLMRARIFGK